MYKLTANELYHHGVKGMKWGVRRYQNKDGSLTALGKQQRDTYGMTKHEVKKAIKTSKKEHSSRSSTGTNWDKVRADHKKALRNDIEYNNARAKQTQYSAYAKQGSSPTTRIVDYIMYDDHGESFYKRQVAKYRAKAYKRYVQIGDSYANQYADALLKDIRYSGDFKTGREMLKQYNLVNDKGKYQSWITDEIDTW